MKKLRELCTLENILCLYIIICPILDISSFLFRNYFKTIFSPSTIIRPIIPVICFTILFFKENNKLKKIKIICVYFIYSLIHIYFFQKLHNGSSYGNIKNELQYIINYSLMVINIYLFYVLIKDKAKVKKVVYIALIIYVISIYFAIITNTSSYTYLEGIGFKGYFESGNSLCTVLILGLCIMFSDFNFKQWGKIVLIIFTGIYLIVFSEMRTGLFGFGIIVGAWIIGKFFIAIRDKIFLNKKQISIITFGIILFVVLIFVLGARTLDRRKFLKQNELNNIDKDTQSVRYVTGDILDIYRKIQKNEISDDYMLDAEKKAIVDLCEYAEKHKISNVDLRKQQLIYNLFLVREQKNPLLILFGNGYKNQTGELVMEMEIPALICNFGLVGFALYLGPILYLVISSLIKELKRLKEIKIETIMYITGCVLGILLSSVSGYVFFNFSSMTMAIILSVLLYKNKNIGE